MNHNIEVSARGASFPLFHTIDAGPFMLPKPEIQDSFDTTYLLHALGSNLKPMDVKNLIVPTDDSKKFFPDIALFIFDEVDDDDDEEVDELYNDAIGLIFEEEYEEAIEIFEQIIEDYPDSLQAINSLSMLLSLYQTINGDLTELLDYFSLLDDDALQTVLLQVQALTNMMNGDYVSAIYFYEEVLNDPDIDTVSQLLAILDQALCALLLQNESGSRALPDIPNLPSNYEEYLTLQDAIFAQIYNLNDDDEFDGNVPEIIAITMSNYPNPFNPETTIAFLLPVESIVSIDIYNIRGQKVKTLVNDLFESGQHEVVWNGLDDNGRNMASGLYFYRLRSGETTLTRRMVLLK